MLVRQRIALERRKNGFSTAQLAEKLGVTKGNISRWENGYVREIPADMIRKTADVFNLSLAEFVGDDPQYAYLLPTDHKKKHSHSKVLTDEENAMVDWYRGLDAGEQNLIKKLWQSP